MIIHGAHLAAARKRRQMLQTEEEDMTRYTPEDLSGDWEFKIVRAEMPVFRKPEVLQQLLQEESVFGWQLVEKLDDMRVRFKRPAAARKRDLMLPEGFDPYRSHFGAPIRIRVLVINMVVLAVFILGLTLFLKDGAVQAGAILAMVIAMLLVLALTFLIVARSRRR